MIKLKNLLKEGLAWERKFGEKLPTLDSVQKKHNEKKLNEAEQYGIKFSPQDHYELHSSLEDMDIDDGIGYSESLDIYDWKNRKHYRAAVGELNAAVLKAYAPVYKAKQKFETTKWHKEKDKIFNKWRKKDGSKQGD